MILLYSTKSAVFSMRAVQNRKWQNDYRSRWVNTIFKEQKTLSSNVLEYSTKPADFFSNIARTRRFPPQTGNGRCSWPRFQTISTSGYALLSFSYRAPILCRVLVRKLWNWCNLIFLQVLVLYRSYFRTICESL